MCPQDILRDHFIKARIAQNSTMNVLYSNYQTVRAFVNRFKKRCHETDENDKGITCEFPSANYSAMVDALGPTQQPFFQKGALTAADSVQVCQSSTVVAPNVAELLHISAPSHFTKGTTAMMNPADMQIVNSFEIAAAKLSKDGFAKLSSKFPIKKIVNSKALELRPYKLVIHQAGDHPDAHRDSLCGDGSFGTLVLILNSEYTGGELEITHNGQTEVVTGPYSWVAMYGDCQHKINPVTSGTRVSLIFDIAIDWRSIAGVETFWYKDPADLPPSAVQAAVHVQTGAAPAMNAQQKAVLTKALMHELSTLTSVHIALEGMYDSAAVLPGALQGGDLMLHAVLAEDFELSLAHCAVHHNEDIRKISAEPFTTFEKGPQDEYGPVTDPVKDRYGYVKVRKLRPVREEWTRTKLVLPRAPSVDYVCDNAYDSEMGASEVYIFTCLRVSKKEVVTKIKEEVEEGKVEEKAEGQKKRKQAESSGDDEDSSDLKMAAK
jgi:hypothetical protein